MQKTLMWAVAVALGAGVAGTQTWTYQDGQYRGEFKGCVRSGANEVTCTFADTYLGQEETKTTFWNTDKIAVILNGGTPVKASDIVVAGQRDRYSIFTTAYKDLPINVVARFNVPAGMTVIPRISYREKVLNDVRIGGTSEVASAAPKPISAPAAPNIAGNWNATLTDCKPSGTAVVCTATLRK